MSNKDPREEARAHYLATYKRQPDGACFHGPYVVQVYAYGLNVYYKVADDGSVYDPQVD